MKITVETTVAAPIDEVWRAWNTPADVMQWNAASDDWHTPASEVDLREGGKFCHRMEAKDGSFGFDFAGEYVRVIEPTLIEYALGDDRCVLVEFVPGDKAVTVRETFDAEDQASGEQQRQGWQAILDRFRDHVESKTAASSDPA